MRELMMNVSHQDGSIPITLISVNKGNNGIMHAMFLFSLHKIDKKN